MARFKIDEHGIYGAEHYETDDAVEALAILMDAVFEGYKVTFKAKAEAK